MKRFLLLTLHRFRQRLDDERQFWHRAKVLRPHLPQLYAALSERTAVPLTHHERDLMDNALTFSALVADDVAVPRAAIIAIPDTASFHEVLALFGRSQHSRLPVMGQSLDDLKGFLLLKDVVLHLDAPQTFKLDDLLRPLTVVPETMPLPRVLQQMKRAKVPLVVVTDEFGGTSGLISLKDILEQLVGSMADEHAAQAEAVVSLGGHRYRVRGDVALEALDSLLGTTLASQSADDVTTLAGLILLAAQHIPMKGEAITLAPGIQAEITETDGRRVLLVVLSLYAKAHG